MDEEDEALKELNDQLDMNLNDLAGVKAADNTVEEPKADKEQQSQSEAEDIPVGCPVLAFTEKTNQWYPGGIVKAKNADGSYKIFWTAFGNCSEHAANQVQVAPNVDVADIGKEDPKKLLDELKSFQDDPRDVKKATYFNSETEEWDLDKLRGDLQQAMLTNGMVNLSMENLPTPQSQPAAAPSVPATLPEDGDQLFELLQKLDEEADKENYYIEDEGWDIDGLKDDIQLAQKTVTAYAVGDRVIECGWLGSEYKGTVLKVDPEKQQLWVHYDGYDTSADRWVHCNSVRKLERGEDVEPAPGDHPTPSSPPAGESPQQAPLVLPEVRPDSEDIAEILESLGLSDCADKLIAKGLTTLGVLKNAREEVLRSCGVTEMQSINELQFKIGERFKSKKGPLRFAYLLSLDSAANKEDYYDEEAKEWDVDGIEDDVRIAQGKISTASGGGDRVALWLPYTKRSEVVGDGGSTIEKIKSTTSAKIKIGYENFGGYCRIIIEGSKSQVKKARSTIEETAGTQLVTKPPPGAMPNQNFENANSQMLAASKNPKLMMMMQQMMMISQQMSMMRQRGMMEQAKMMQMQWMQQYQKMLAMYQQNVQKVQAAVQARKQQQMKSMAQNITGWQWGGAGGGGGMMGMGGANGLNDWIRMMGRSGMGQQMGWGFQQNEVNLNEVIRLMANDPNWASRLRGQGQGPSLPAPSKDPGKDWQPGDDYPSGMVVHCRWENNGQWYQGQIQQKNADGTYKVFWPQWRNHSDSVAPEDIMAKRPCPQCGTENKAGANFCVVCGHSFAGRPNAGTAVQMQGWQWGPGPQDRQRGFGRGHGGHHHGGHRGPRRFGGGGRRHREFGSYAGGGRGRRNEFVREQAQHMPPVAAAPPQAPAVTQLW